MGKNKNQKRDFLKYFKHTSVLYSRKIAALDVPGVSSGRDIMREASKNIKTQSAMLKRELDRGINSKLQQRVKSLEQKINNIKMSIQHIKIYNEHLYHDADSKLAELDASLSMIREMFEKLNYIKTEGDLMDIQCREIEDKIKLTATKISSSMTSLNQLIDP